MRHFGLLAAAAAAACLAAPASAGAKTIRDFHQILSDVPARAAVHVGNIPLEIVSPPSKYVSFRAGGDRYRGQWNNIISVAGTTSFLLKIQRREIRRGSGDRTLIFADRALTRRERRDFKVLADIGRDADVLVVARNHPACNGLTSAQVRQIASGAITRWSEVMALPTGQPDKIALRHTTYQRAFEARFGVTKLPRGARGATDGGLSEIAAGDRAVAGITSWARFRRSGAGCAVPLDGVAPSNASVHALTFAGAHPLTLVAHRKRQQAVHDRLIRKAFVRYIKSRRAAKRFRRNGMLLVAEAPPADDPPASQPTSGPSHDRQGRPINAIRVMTRGSGRC